MSNDAAFRQRIAEIYRWLDSQINSAGLTGGCKICGRCCDFEKSGHRLFISSPELIYLPEGWLKPMPAGRCPFNEEGKCAVYDFRFAGCRIYYCSGDADFQSQLSERVLRRLKSVCRQFNIPYRYTDLAVALNLKNQQGISPAFRMPNTYR